MSVPQSPLEDMVRALSLDSLGKNPAGDDAFVGPSQWMPTGRVFGGQVLAQCLMAAQHTIEDQDRTVHSMHGYFLRPGDIEQPIHFTVDRLRDGRSFSTRRVQAFQNDRAIFSMIASFQDHDPGIEHQTEMPTDIPGPETLPTAATLIGENPHPVAQYWAKARPFDLRHVPSPIYFKVEGELIAHQAVWIKSLGDLPNDKNLHRAAIAYASDYTILESIIRKHGIAWAHPGLKSASLDHAMWFHREARADQWLLYVQESHSAQGGRGLSLGRIYTRDGILVASVAQEGMIRVPEIN